WRGWRWDGRLHGIIGSRDSCEKRRTESVPYCRGLALARLQRCRLTRRQAEVDLIFVLSWLRGRSSGRDSIEARHYTAKPTPRKGDVLQGLLGRATAS